MPRTPRAPKKEQVSTRLGKWDSFLRHLAVCGAIAPAARAAGVGRSTVYDEMRRDPEFLEEVQSILSQCVEQVESTLFQCALNPASTTDRIFFLKTRKPEVYADRLNPQQVQQIRDQARGEVLKEIEEELAALTPQARKIVMDAMAKRAAKELPQ